MLIVILACLGAGVGLVATAPRYPARAGRMEKAGGMLVVTGLIGLGFLLASRS